MDSHAVCQNQACNSVLRKKLCIPFGKWKIETLSGNVQQASGTTESNKDCGNQ